jgi:glutaredoxin
VSVYLYKLKGCTACEKAREYLVSQGYTPLEVIIDNPLLEIGIQMLFKDGKVHAPVVCIPDKGIYIFDNEVTQMLRLVSLEQSEQ